MNFGMVTIQSQLMLRMNSSNSTQLGVTDAGVNSQTPLSPHNYYLTKVSSSIKVQPITEDERTAAMHATFSRKDF